MQGRIGTPAGGYVGGVGAQVGSMVGGMAGMPSAAMRNPVPPREPVQRDTGKKMTVARLRKANELLARYKSGKSAQDDRVVTNELWYRQRHWELMKGNGGDEDSRYQTKSAWLFNALNILHSDAMTSFPRLNVLAREENDEEEATRLSSILPVVMDQCDIRGAYDTNTWRKGRSGTGVYAVLWDTEKLNGLGDIAITPVDVLNLFWEPGKDDIQRSANVFHVEMIERDYLRERYPELKQRDLSSDGFAVREYNSDDKRQDGDSRVAVVDWYYKAWNGQRTVLHYCKYVGTTALYASEDDNNAPEGKEPPSVRGWYDHGMYPFVIDAFYPIEGTPAGFGLIDVNKSAQEQIDLMNSAIVTNALMNAYPRYFERHDGGVNEKDLSDWTKVIIGFDGGDPYKDLMPVQVPTLPGVCVNVLNDKIEELKQTSGSQDVVNGGSTGGVTAYSAIAAMIETAGKNTKAFSMGSYRAMQKIGNLVIELIRQFYDLPRQFRITGERGEMEYVEYTNAKLQKQAIGMDMAGEELYRLPVFDLDVSAERETTYTRLAQNELAKELAGMGVFNPQMVDQSLLMLDMMDFDGKEELEQKVRAMGDMAQKLAQFQQLALQLAQRYDPAMAEEIANMIMQGAPGVEAAPAEPTGGTGPVVEMDPITGAKKKEHANGPKARGMVDEATMPD